MLASDGRGGTSPGFVRRLWQDAPLGRQPAACGSCSAVHRGLAGGESRGALKEGGWHGSVRARTGAGLFLGFRQGPFTLRFRALVFRMKPALPVCSRNSRIQKAERVTEEARAVTLDVAGRCKTC